MSAGATADTPTLHPSSARFGAAGAYAALGSLLLITQFTGLSRSYWHDEIVTVRDYVLRGPAAILSGPYIPNNHELYSLLGWATTTVVGESELVLRLWSVLPFVVGVGLVVGWLHVRVGALTATFYLFLVTFSPLLLDIMRQARGYGLAFLAMSVAVVAALEADRHARTRSLVVFFIAGVGGSLTLPHFALAFVATACVLLTNPNLRRGVLGGLALALIALGAWYAPHAGALAESSQQEVGLPIPWSGLLVSPVEQVLVPSLLGIDGFALTNGIGRFPIIAVFALTIVASPLLRERRTAAVLCGGFVLTLSVLWALQVSVVPRFLSYLVVPLFMLLASGAAALTTRHGMSLWVRAAFTITLLGLVVVRFAETAPNVLRLPREAHRSAIERVREADPAAPVLVRVHQPADLAYYLGRPVVEITSADLQERVCDATAPVIYITQPFEIDPAPLPCARREGVTHRVFDQYTRGGQIDVWHVPPAPRA